MDGGGPIGMKNGPQREETVKCVLGKKKWDLKGALHQTKIIQNHPSAKCVSSKYINHGNHWNK